MSDLTFGPSFKVKRWSTGFGELSFWWIQICIGSLMRRSSSALFSIEICFDETVILFTGILSKHRLLLMTKNVQH